ncbi:MAG TPA: putative baseplate assembly protein [Roseiflexaceae bacterium]|nr:putative baseplate assembly protein [Roseiflexaceae bacterium]
MPIRPPALDDRTYDSLVEELVARIPAHTPEWTNPLPGDPGRTLIELFAWMGDALLYRANLIPERQRLAFLRLLGAGMRPAQPARGLVTVLLEDALDEPALLPPLTRIDRPVPFETRTALRAVPVTAAVFYKRPLSDAELRDPAMARVVAGLQQVYRISGGVRPYATTPLFAAGEPVPAGFDLITQTADRCLWLALLAPTPARVPAARAALATNPGGGQALLNIGVAPSISVPALFEEIGPRAAIPHLWEISRVNARGDAEYQALDVVEDTSRGLTGRGVLRLALPEPALIGAPSNNVRERVTAGVGDQPPRLDSPEQAARLIGWLRLRPRPETPLASLRLSWIGINAVEIDQRQSLSSRVIGTSSGAPDQEFALPGAPVEPETLRIEVEEEGRGYQPWLRVDDLALAGRDQGAYQLDPEAGTVRFGDGLRGRVPDAGRRVRVALARIGGGKAGNQAPGSITQLSSPPSGRTVKLLQSLATEGGEDAETLEQAERRIPALFRHRDRAVTADDYRRLAAETPGVRLGRVEVLPRFRPQQRQSGVAGTVSVMVLPQKDGFQPANPQPDRPTLEAVHSHLDARRPLATELYVIGCEYVRIGVSVGVSLLDNLGALSLGQGGLAASADGRPLSRDSVVAAVREALRLFLWPLAPGGYEGAGWPLGRTVRDRELEVVVARVPGVDAVARVNLFLWQNGVWQQLPRRTPDAPVELPLAAWQLPELLGVAVAVDAEPPTTLDSVNPFADPSSVAVPVVPTMC